MWFDKNANIEKLKEFGTIVYTHIPKEKRKKFDKKAVKCVLVGFCDNGYRIYNSNTKQVQVSRDLIFGNDKKNTKQSIESVNTSEEKGTNKVDENKKGAILHWIEVKNNECFEIKVDDQRENESQSNKSAESEVIDQESDESQNDDQNDSLESSVHYASMAIYS